MKLYQRYIFRHWTKMILALNVKVRIKIWIRSEHVLSNVKHIDLPAVQTFLFEKRNVCENWLIVEVNYILERTAYLKCIAAKSI